MAVAVPRLSDVLAEESCNEISRSFILVAYTSLTFAFVSIFYHWRSIRMVLVKLTSPDVEKSAVLYFIYLSMWDFRGSYWHVRTNLRYVSIAPT
jgi:hypothetical protein